MKLTTALLMMVFLSGCMGLGVIQSTDVKPRNTSLDKPPKVYLTLEQINQMSDVEIKEFFDIIN